MLVNAIAVKVENLTTSNWPSSVRSMRSTKSGPATVTAVQNAHGLLAWLVWMKLSPSSISKVGRWASTMRKIAEVDNRPAEAVTRNEAGDAFQ